MATVPFLTLFAFSPTAVLWAVCVSALLSSEMCYRHQSRAALSASLQNCWGENCQGR